MCNKWSLNYGITLSTFALSLSFFHLLYLTVSKCSRRRRTLALLVRRCQTLAQFAHISVLLWMTKKRQVLVAARRRRRRRRLHGGCAVAAAVAGDDDGGGGDGVGKDGAT